MNNKLSFIVKNNTAKSIFFLMAMFSISNGFSQSTSLGIRAGVNLLNWNLSDVSETNTSSLFGPDAGVFAAFKLSKAFSLEPGVTFSGSGAELNYNNAEKIKYRLSYLQVPIMARYVFANGIGFFAGPQIGFLLAAKAKEDNGSKEDIKAVLNKTDFSIAGGIEYNFPVGFSIRAKYNAGLTNIYNQGSATIKNYSFGLGVAYQFNLAERRTK